MYEDSSEDENSDDEDGEEEADGAQSMEANAAQDAMFSG